MPFTNEDKHFIKILHKEKRYRYGKFICEFPNKKWRGLGSDRDLIKKTDKSDSIARRSGSGRPRTASHGENINAVADLVQSQEHTEDRP